MKKIRTYLWSAGADQTYASVQDFVTPRASLDLGQNVQEIIRQVGLINETTRPDTGSVPSDDEPSWMNFYGVSKKNITPPVEPQKYDFYSHFEQQQSSTDTDSEKPEPEAIVPPKPKPAPSQIWSGLHTAVPAPYHHQTTTKSKSSSRNHHRSKAAPEKAVSDSERDSRVKAGRSLAKGTRSSMTLKDLIASKRASEASLATNSTLAVVDDDAPPVPNTAAPTTATKANESRPRSGPNRTRSQDAELGRRKAFEARFSGPGFYGGDEKSEGDVEEEESEVFRASDRAVASRLKLFKIMSEDEDLGEKLKLGL